MIVAAVSLDHVSPAARSAIDAADGDAGRATRYAIGAVALSFAGNAVHLVNKVDTSGVASADGRVAAVQAMATGQNLAVVAEALFGPSLVLICSHLLMHADRGRRIERFPLWAGFVCGAALSSVHLWAIAYSVLGPSSGAAAGLVILAGVAAALLPIGVEGASIGSIQQAARFRSERDQLTADIVAAEAARIEAEDQARRDADAEVRRRVEVERAEAERLTAEAAAEERRIAAETERERQLLADRQKAARAASKARKSGTGGPSKDGTEADIAVYLAANAGVRGGKGPTAAVVAEALGISDRHVTRSSAWKHRHTTAPALPTPPTGTEPADADDGPAGDGTGVDGQDDGLDQAA